MHRVRGFSILLMAVGFSMVAASCTPIGAAAGAGATLGIAAAKEGGVSGAANDLRIKTLISEKWFSYKVDTFTKLSLTVDEGRVLITGIVQNPDDRVEAVRLAWQVDGVKQVINEIRVANAEGLAGYIKDTWITTRLRTAMTFDRDVQAINYSIDTVDGTVYLMGVARNQRDLDKAVALARTIPGVKQVVTYVKPYGQPVANDSANMMPTLTEPMAARQAPAQAAAQPVAQQQAAPAPLPHPQGAGADPYAPSAYRYSNDPYAPSGAAPATSTSGAVDSGTATGMPVQVAPVMSAPLSPTPVSREELK